MKKESGFTLIELAVTALIIGILSLIALPNFKAAQVRAKVSRVKSDFSAIAIAMESYNIDYKTYPVYHSRQGTDGVFSPNFSINPYDTISTGWIGNSRENILTTPVSYLSKFPDDPFYPNSKSFYGDMRPLWYSFFTWNEFVTTTTSWGLPGHVGQQGPGPFSRLSHASYWQILSLGPDLQDSGFITNYGTAGWVPGDLYINNLYDPSNGITSNGDIWRTSSLGQL